VSKAPKKPFEKTVLEVLDYKFDFKPFSNGRKGAETDFLEAGETIESYTLTPETGITIDTDAKADTDTTVLVWYSGGTLNITYSVVCLAVTSEGRTLERVMRLKIVTVSVRK